MDVQSRERQKRLFAMGATAILVATVMGLISGTRPPRHFDQPHPERNAQQRSAKNAAPSYAELREGRRGSNREMYASAFERLREAGPGLMDRVEQTEGDRQQALEERAARRAYAGAPPVVPHAVQERAPGACLTCHAEGAVVGDQRAPAMSHDPYVMCVQCHAIRRQEVLGPPRDASVALDSEFVGAKEPERGEVVWEGAPPSIPHPTLMRENCSSCHGRQGLHGIRTPHPYQQSCRQCHAAASDFDPSGPPPLGTSGPSSR